MEETRAKQSADDLQAEIKKKPEIAALVQWNNKQNTELCPSKLRIRHKFSLWRIYGYPLHVISVLPTCLRRSKIYRSACLRVPLGLIWPFQNNKSGLWLFHLIRSWRKLKSAKATCLIACAGNKGTGRYHLKAKCALFGTMGVASIFWETTSFIWLQRFITKTGDFKFAEEVYPGVFLALIWSATRKKGPVLPASCIFWKMLNFWTLYLGQTLNRSTIWQTSCIFCTSLDNRSKRVLSGRPDKKEWMLRRLDWMNGRRQSNNNP